MAYNKERKEKVEEERAMMLLRDKLAVLGLEQELLCEINKVDCLEEGNFTKEVEDDLERIAKPIYAQAQDPLTKINLGDEGEDLPTFIRQLLDKEVSIKVISLLKDIKIVLLWNMSKCLVKIEIW
ncbi:hypothetical protein Adt_42154 [Abeliophyllum distichum]|uniref:Uncharacterized protein n=1 Tax=Abeliophyllum distichum TaxID=126358 RepID=A0ABD1PQV9_9LAMI